MERPSRDDYYMSIARTVSTRSNCVKRQVGAIVVVNDMIVATGYNGTPRSYPNCFDGGCPRCADTKLASGERIEECIYVHAEQNCITHAAKRGSALEFGHMYCLLAPCITCSKLIINAGIVSMYVDDASYKSNGLELLKACGVRVVTYAG